MPHKFHPSVTRLGAVTNYKFSLCIVLSGSLFLRLFYILIFPHVAQRDQLATLALSPLLLRRINDQSTKQPMQMMSPSFLQIEHI